MKTVQSKKDNGVHCCAHGCKGKPVYKLGGLCSKHYRRKIKAKDPVYDRFTNFKHNALRRCKEFTITLAQFREFCERTGYIIDKGVRGRNATVDRIDNNLGYHIDNIQLLTHAQNVRKYYDHDRHYTDISTMPQIKPSVAF